MAGHSAAAAGRLQMALRPVAAVPAGWLTVSGRGAWMDGLRALCAAAWSAGPPSGDPQEQRRTAEEVLAAIEPARLMAPPPADGAAR